MFLNSRIYIYFDMIIFCKKFNFDLLTPRVRGGGRGFQAKIFSTMLLHQWFPLIWYATWPSSEKVKFYLWLQPLGPPRGQTQAFDQKSGLICFLFIVPLSAFATMLLHSRFPLICNMIMFWKKLILTFWPPGPGGGGVCRGNICYHVAAFVIPFKLICNMTMFWKS